jgi:carbon starvation protein
LTTVDAGTRVGRYLPQDGLGAFWKPLGKTGGMRSAWVSSALVVGAWGWFLIQGVRDPQGGVNSLWPLFGIANQLLAAIALVLGTTVILKMQLNRADGKPARALITFLPLLWLLAVTGTASLEKIFDADPRTGFLAAARHLDGRLKFNAYLDAAVTAAFLAMVVFIVAAGAREWVLLLARRKAAQLTETPPVWHSEQALREGRPANFLGAASIALLLLKELSGEAAAGKACQQCDDAAGRQKAWRQTVEKRFEGVNRCC